MKICQTLNRDIMIGVVDYAKQKDKKNSFISGNAMCYSGCNGRKYPEKYQEGDGFKKDDVVEVEVNRSAGTVKYWVDKVLKATHKNDILADSTRVLMPYVEMYHNNDIVKFMVE